MSLAGRHPFHTVQGQEWQTLSWGSPKSGGCQAKVGSTDDTGKVTDMKRGLKVESMWGEKGIFLKTPWKAIRIKDNEPNLRATLSRDDRGQATLHVRDTSGGYTCQVDVPLGDLSKADPRFFEAGALQGKVTSLDLEMTGGKGSLQLGPEHRYRINSGAIFPEF